MADDNDIIARLVVEGVDQFKQGLKDGKVSVDALDSSVTGVDKSVTNFRTSLLNLKNQIVAANVELHNMAQAGQQGSPRFKELTDKVDALNVQAGKLKLGISVAQKEIAAFGTGTQGLDKFIRSVELGVNTVGIFQAAETLLGTKNKELEQTLIELNSLMLAANALHSIGAELVRDDSIAKQAAAKATALYNFVVGESTGALKAFRIALGLTGIGLLIIGLGLLIANWDNVKEAITGTSQAMRDQAALRTEASKQVGDEIGEMERLKVIILDQSLSYETRNKALLKLKEIAPEYAKSIKDISISEKDLQKIIDQEIDVLIKREEARILANRIAEREINHAADVEISAAKRVALFFSYNKSGSTFQSRVADQKAANEAAFKEQQDADKKLLQQLTDSLGDRNDVGKSKYVDPLDAKKKALEDEIAVIQTRLLVVEAGSKAELQLKEDLINKEAQLSKLGEDKKKQALINAQSDKGIFDLEIKYNDNRLKLAEIFIEDKLATVKNGSREELMINLQKLALEREMEITAAYNSENTAEDKEKLMLAIKEKYNGLSLKATQKYYAEEQKDNEKNNKLRIKADEGLLKLQERGQKAAAKNREKEKKEEEAHIRDVANIVLDVSKQIQNFSNELSSLIINASRINADHEIAILDDKKKRGVISEKEYNKQVNKIKNEQAIKEHNAEIAAAAIKIPIAGLEAFISGLKYGPVVAGVFAAIAIAFASVELAQIKSTPPPKYAGGGWHRGKPHSQGGEIVEVEDQEFTVQKKATQFYTKKYGSKFFDDINTMRYDPVLNSQKLFQNKDIQHQDYKMYEHLATIAGYLKQGYKIDEKGNAILSDISQSIKSKRGYV